MHLPLLQPALRLAYIICLAVLLFPAYGRCQETADLSSWQAQPAESVRTSVAEDGKATLESTGEGLWGFLMDSGGEQADVEAAATFTILDPAKRFDFFGSSWSVWPPRDFGGDRGYEAALLLRAKGDTPHDSHGYRVQLSAKYQDVALVKFPDGGYLRVVPCKIEVNRPHVLAVTVRGDEIVVSVDGQEKIRCRDTFLPLTKGRTGVGVSSGAKVTVENVTVRPLATVEAEAAPVAAHEPKFSARPWLGGRIWVFDGDEPVAELHSEQDQTCFAKLRPGYKPQLTFDTHWGIENQGAFKEGASRWTAPAVAGGGKTISASWSARSLNDRFTTRSNLVIGFDARRGTYTYDIESELEVLPGNGPFHFRYGYDFEHHAPIDPFRWQYFVVRGTEGKLFHRPVSPFDPGVMDDLYGRSGLRMWYGRHVEEMHVAPAVEYHIADQSNSEGPRKLRTAVCAAFYDTGIFFDQETAEPGTKIQVKYRYTGYPAAEAEALFKESVIYPSPTLDPNHHFIFADEWPKLTFSDFEPMSKTWIYGRRPFMTGHHRRPTYELAKNVGAGSTGFAMKLGPDSYGKSDLAVPQPLEKGRYAVTALVKSDNATGPGGRIEISVTEAKTGNVLSETTHYLGNGTFDWTKTGFAFDVPENAAGLSLGLGNAGTGDVYITDVQFTPVAEGAPLPEGALAQANATPPALAPAPAGAMADYHMLEQKGLHVLSHASGLFGIMELANLGWVIDEGRPALRFADNTSGREDYPRGRNLDQFLSNKAYDGHRTVPAAISGTNGGELPDFKAFTVNSWIKPAAEMGKGGHGNKGDVVGLGARRFILRLNGPTAPYRLTAAVNVEDVFESDALIEAGRWYHVAMTGEPTPENKWRIRLFLDGKQVHEAVTQKADTSMRVPPSLILGAEIYYLHDAYYRGLIGRTTVFDRALPAEEIARFAAELP